jgi:hypothetical protein
MEDSRSGDQKFPFQFFFQAGDSRAIWFFVNSGQRKVKEASSLSMSSNPFVVISSRDISVGLLFGYFREKSTETGLKFFANLAKAVFWRSVIDELTDGILADRRVKFLSKRGLRFAFQGHQGPVKIVIDNSFFFRYVHAFLNFVEMSFLAELEAPVMRIDYVNRPDISGKPTEQALQILSDKLGDTMVKVMELNNAIEDLKTKIMTLRG